jgi:hypothetical protein
MSPDCRCLEILNTERTVEHTRALIIDRPAESRLRGINFISRFGDGEQINGGDPAGWFALERSRSRRIDPRRLAASAISARSGISSAEIYNSPPVAHRGTRGTLIIIIIVGCVCAVASR